jgi:hypothetical protein
MVLSCHTQLEGWFQAFFGWIESDGTTFKPTKRVGSTTPDSQYGSGPEKLFIITIIIFFLSFFLKKIFCLLEGTCVLFRLGVTWQQNSEWIKSLKVGFEPTTSQLTSDRSTIELLRINGWFSHQLQIPYYFP